MEENVKAVFAGEARVHIGLEVADVERSVAFYRVLLGTEPVKRRPGYAKFEPREPSLNLSLNEGIGGRPGRAGGSGHFGLQVHSSAAVGAAAQRLRAAGLAVREESGTACCYAVQDKVWADDPDGNPWEVFVVLGESERRAPAGSEATACCVPAERAVAQREPAEHAAAQREPATACCTPAEREATACCAAAPEPTR